MGPGVPVDEAVARARELVRRQGAAGGPALLGIAGPPGVGKSTLAELVVDAVDGAVLVGMDGFHLAHSALDALGRVDRKGAPDTFDADGYLALLRRVRCLPPGGTVWAPQFHRDIEDAVAGAVAVDGSATLVVTEGNYLLLDEAPWADVRGLLDECWYIDLPDDVRRARLQARHERHGRTATEARARTWGSDERNAVLVAESRDRADLWVTGVGRPDQSLD